MPTTAPTAVATRPFARKAFTRRNTTKNASISRPRSQFERLPWNHSLAPRPPPCLRRLPVDADPAAAFVSRYALGRDYHKTLRRRLRELARRIEDRVGAFGYRVFVDSAPVLEKPLAEKAGLGWIGKHTNLINRRDGSWFFLGELYTDLPLPVDGPVEDHCGSCSACIEICPTDAIVAPYQLDARRCISYLTIEHRGPVDEDLRALLGNRIYGCDDCLAVCPWNKFASRAAEVKYHARDDLLAPDLAELAHWLKGAGGTVGYDVFTKPARLLETAAKSRQEGPVLQAMRALLEIASRVPDVTVSRALPAVRTRQSISMAMVRCSPSSRSLSSSTTSTFMPRMSGEVAKCLLAFSSPRLKTAVKLKVLPWPGSLSTQISPPIKFASFLLMVRPSPVPPYLRVVEVSAWVKD